MTVLIVFTMIPSNKYSLEIMYADGFSKKCEHCNFVPFCRGAVNLRHQKKIMENTDFHFVKENIWKNN